MAANSEVSVTLSDALWRHLRRQAARLSVSIELLVAGLVCDTIEGLTDGRVAPRGSMPGAAPSGLQVATVITRNGSI